MPYENHFVVLFKSEISDEFIHFDKWYLFDDLQDIIFVFIGNIVFMLLFIEKFNAISLL